MYHDENQDIRMGSKKSKIVNGPPNGPRLSLSQFTTRTHVLHELPVYVTVKVAH